MIDFYILSLALIFGFSVLVFLLLFFISAPYGKFLREGWGPVIKSKWAWMLMESPSPLLISVLFILSANKSFVTWTFLILWLSHYLHRTLIYPFTQAGSDKPYPLILVFMAFGFNILNGFANGYGVFNSNAYSNSYFFSWNYISGLLLFLTGFYINKTADEKLRKFRKMYPGTYIKPEGWLFRYISCPHYFGELVEWGGWAVMTMSFPGLAFFVFTGANLIPRAVATHKWYKSSFSDYPDKRKAIIPFIL